MKYRPFKNSKRKKRRSKKLQSLSGRKLNLSIKNIGECYVLIGEYFNTLTGGISNKITSSVFCFAI